MKSKEEIEKRLLELKKEYTNRLFSVGNEPETICVSEQAKLLEWVLDGHVFIHPKQHQKHE